VSTQQTGQFMFDAQGKTHMVAAPSEADAADRHATNGDLLAWADYNAQRDAEAIETGHNPEWCNSCAERRTSNDLMDVK